MVANDNYTAKGNTCSFYYTGLLELVQETYIERETNEYGGGSILSPSSDFGHLVLIMVFLCWFGNMTLYVRQTYEDGGNLRTRGCDE